MRIHLCCICSFFHKKELAFIPTFKGPRAFFPYQVSWDNNGLRDKQWGKLLLFQVGPQGLSCLSVAVTALVSGGFTGQLHLLPFIFEALGFMNDRPRFAPAGIELFGLV